MAVKPGKYQHSGGRQYLIYGTAQDESGQAHLLYLSLEPAPHLCTAPLAMLSELSPVSETASSNIKDLWGSGQEEDWMSALLHYWELCSNPDLELYLAQLDPLEVAHMDGQEFYHFLHDQYFVWKYTAPNRLATTRKALENYANCTEKLIEIRQEIFCRQLNVKAALEAASKLPGLGIAGASGLLSILFPKDFGTVDRFVVERLQGTDAPDVKPDINGIDPESISLSGAVALEEIMRDKAKKLNGRFQTDFWTPRKIDMVLWSFGRRR